MPVWVMVLADIVAIGVFLIVFSLFHHVLPQKPDMEPVALPTSQPSAPAEQPAQQPEEGEPSPEQTQTAQTAGHKFESMFTQEVVHTDNKFSNNNVSVEVETFSSNGVTYHVADVYVRDVTYLKTAFGQDEFGKTDWVQDICAANNAFVAVNGDQCGQHREGVVVRNGILYRETPFHDVAVLENDGTLNTYTQDEFDLQAVKDRGVWQVWSFGPVLLTDGQPMEDFNTDVGGANPRTAIGMIEPLHYLLVTVDGRGESAGLSMKDLSKLMYDLGCTSAYNLDGGGTAAMAVDGKLYSTPSKDRKASDVIYIPMD